MSDDRGTNSNVPTLDGTYRFNRTPDSKISWRISQHQSVARILVRN